MLNKYIVMKSASPFEMSQFIKKSVGKHDIRVLGGDDSKGSVLKHISNQSISFSVIKYGADVEVSGPPQKKNYQIQLVLKGNCIIDHCGEAIDLRAGDAAIINPHSDCSLVYKNACEKLIITLDADAIQSRLVKEVGLQLKKPINFDVKVEKTRDNGYLIDLLKFYGLLLDKQKESKSFDLISTMMTDSIINSLLKFHPNSYDYLLEKNISRLPVHLKMALEFINMNIANDFSLNDVLDYIDAGERVLYKSFSEFLNTTPLAYIKSLKLNKIRSELTSSRSGEIKITELAMQYGFYHLGRFSNEYKSRFGELPSETLGRRYVNRAN